MIELENKYKVDKVSIDLNNLAYTLIGDVYKSKYVRIRVYVQPQTLVVKRYITFKVGKGRRRIEIELPIPKFMYNFFVNKRQPTLWKKRYDFSGGVSIDQYIFWGEQDDELFLIEVEGLNKGNKDFLNCLTIGSQVENVTNNECFRGYELYKKVLTEKNKDSII